MTTTTTSDEIVLYGGYPFRAARCAWLLKELDVPYTATSVNLHNKDSDEFSAFLKINPNGTIPCLTHGDLTLVESGAICMYIADKFGGDGKHLCPPMDSPLRGPYYQWCFYATATVDEAIVQLYLQLTHTKEEDRDLKLIAKCVKGFHVQASFIEDGLRRSGGPFLLGEKFTACDVVLGWVVWFAMFVSQRCPTSEAGDLFTGHDVLTAYVERLKEREAFKETFKR
eukprot:TRINITY_DN341_c0_g1_i1.p1 TRINITY_DN341_c0_g1~~TRINITY_DN341_c0_g1_i1.p1  ORF type:complete len:226 (-),score=51.75 TRINITY_DN341_c0_g1_i1:44-721(-)